MRPGDSIDDVRGKTSPSVVNTPTLPPAKCCPARRRAASSRVRLAETTVPGTMRPWARGVPGPRRFPMELLLPPANFPVRRVGAIWDRCGVMWDVRGSWPPFRAATPLPAAGAAREACGGAAPRRCACPLPRPNSGSEAWATGVLTCSSLRSGVAALVALRVIAAWRNSLTEGIARDGGSGMRWVASGPCTAGPDCRLDRPPSS
mmetsp:Transcript_31191/g.80882  ORF Transcript_31191/g.80882 Transcript_31191/m.80882 type:complete len:204 (-) Transcript_31191:516-1127(-)